ncbi:MAG TPA: EpsI family protein [Burkholderiaceae bacterium]|nr:EpsI family protein [Burkholderiaceae bacterium]
MNLAQTWRPLAVMVLMVAAAITAVTARPTVHTSEMGPKVDLETMIPARFGTWEIDRTIVPIQPSPDVQQVVERTYSQVLARTYRNPEGQRIMLSIAYGGAQDDSMNYHRPEICYPAQGFPVVQAPRREVLDLPGGPLPVTRLVARQGRRNEPITYWLVVGDELAHFGLEHRWTTLKYGLTGRIPDGMLVRVSSIDPDNRAAFSLQQAFIADMLQALSPDARTRLVGSMVH